MASVKPRATLRPRPSPPGWRSPSRWNGANRRSDWPRGTPGPASTMRSSTRSACALPRRVTGQPRPWRRALSTRLATTRSSRPGSARTSGRSLVDVEADAVGAVEAAQGELRHLVVADRLELRGDGAGGDAGGVEQVVDHAGEPVGGLLDRGGQLAAVGLGQPQVRVAQAPGGGLDRGERGAQVVADRRQQRGAQLGGVGAAAGLGGLGADLLVAQREQGLAGDGVEQAAVGGGQGAAVRRRGGCRGRPRRRRRPVRGGCTPRGPRTRRPPSWPSCRCRMATE